MDQSLEVTGRTVEEAVANGLQQLGLSRDDADVVVLNQGRPGILGIGAEAARVRISARSAAGAGPAAAAPAPVARPHEDAYDEEEEEKHAGPVAPVGEAELEKARDILQQLLGLMDVDAEVDAYIAEDDPFTSSESGPPIILDIQGEDAGLLIGRRGATLHDLQSLVSTMVSRTLKRYVPLRVDVESYQERRFDRIRQIALRAADHVRQRRRPITLEPMSPAERRIVHTTLANNPVVQTQSSGQGEDRRVTVSLRPGAGGGSTAPARGGQQRPGGGRPPFRRNPQPAPPSGRPIRRNNDFDRRNDQG